MKNLKISLVLFCVAIIFLGCKSDKKTDNVKVAEENKVETVSSEKEEVLQQNETTIDEVINEEKEKTSTTKEKKEKPEL